MDDKSIVDLYWERKENAITETDKKYGSYLNRISYNILSNSEDARECVNDTYHSAWKCMPPHRPSILSTFLGKITRRISIDRLRKYQAGKRGGNEIMLVYDELDECIPSTINVEHEIERKEVLEILESLLGSLSEIERKIFLRRYWYVDSVEKIARDFGLSRKKVNSILTKTRENLKNMLGRRGIHECL